LAFVVVVCYSAAYGLCIKTIKINEKVKMEKIEKHTNIIKVFKTEKYLRILILITNKYEKINSLKILNSVTQQIDVIS